MKRIVFFIALLNVIPLMAQQSKVNQEPTCKNCSCVDECHCPPTDNEHNKCSEVTNVNLLGLHIRVIKEYNHNGYGRHYSQIRFNGHSLIDAPWTKCDRTTWLPYVSVGYNGLVSGFGKMELAEGEKWMNVSSRSRNFRLMLIQGSCLLGQWGALRMGLELEVQNFRWDENIALLRSSDGVVVPDLQYTERGIHLRKTKLVNSWFNVPLTLHITPGRRFDVYGGVVGGLRLSSYQKLKASELGKKHIKHENLNLRNLHVGYTAGFYYGRWGLYASYYPHSIFRDGGTNARTISVGLSIKTGYGCWSKH